MKTIILNGSPRKNWNTAMMLREAQKGAESVGAVGKTAKLKAKAVGKKVKVTVK